MEKLKDKIVLITGGGRGIGLGIAKLFESEGAIIVITSRNPHNIEKSIQLEHINVMKCDITKQNSVNTVVKEIYKKFGRIDILVNNAGIFPKIKPLHKITEKEWNDVINVDLTGQFRVTKSVIPHMMKKKNGSIINISSDAGLKAFENFHADAYSAAKSALIQLTKNWALEYAKFNIRVNCICASVVETDMTKKLWLSSEKKRKSTINEHPLGRIGDVKDIALAVLYFASNDSAWTTGAILPVDGGISIK